MTERFSDLDTVHSTAGRDDHVAARIAELPSPAPMTRTSNSAVAGALFEEKFRRGPLPIDDLGATVNDLIFDRMINPHWSPLERAFVDKETAKIHAQRVSPSLCVPETLLVISMENVLSIDHLFDLLQPFVGINVIAKPAHASGAATFLREVVSSADLHLLYQVASTDYAIVMREMQHWQLQRKIIVETLVPRRPARYRTIINSTASTVSHWCIRLIITASAHPGAGCSAFPDRSQCMKAMA